VAWCFPVDKEYCERWFPDFPEAQRLQLVAQLKVLLQDGTIRKMGQNIKFDHSMLRKMGIHTQGWLHDTQLMGFCVDENMLRKDLDELIRVFVPDMAGYADCVDPDTLILTADMRKVRAGDLQVGDELCAFDAEAPGERGGRRKMRKSTVRATQRITRPCLRITAASGRSTIVSVGHLMLSKRGDHDAGGGWRWKRADALQVGSVLKPFPWEDPLDTYDAGYASGVIDGEGWHCNELNRIGVAQRTNIVLERFRQIVTDASIEAGHHTDKRKDVPVVNVTFDGQNSFKILQKFRPKRLLQEAKWQGAGLPTNGIRHDIIVSIEDAGEREVVGLQTSTQTIIADGLCSHNSFNRGVDKSRMIDVPPYDETDAEGNLVRHGMLSYAGGDPDAVYRLAKTLDAQMRQDPKQYNCYRRIMMPAIMVFANSVERYGMLVDRDALNQMERELNGYVSAKYRELIRLVPPAVRRKHLKDGLSFGRNKFMLDILFSKEGFNLAPKLFTKSTKDLDRHEQVPQVGKDHLTYFVNDPRPVVARFCSELIAFTAAQKMLSTYVGNEEEESGFHKYIAADGNIYPSYMLHRTVTGRTASAWPNGQNFPKRSPKNGPDWANMYQGIFLARPGWKLVNCDLSQIELRLVAWMANEKVMLEVYRTGGDIHTTTAKAVLGITDAAWEAMSKADKKLMRFKAKA
jgi:DNA polymerase I-like protein with 3'-5' exonuclease and polymerase domains